MHKDTSLYSLLQLTDFQGKCILWVTSLILQYCIRVIVFFVSSKYIFRVTGHRCRLFHWPVNPRKISAKSLIRRYSNKPSRPHNHCSCIRQVNILLPTSMTSMSALSSNFGISSIIDQVIEGKMLHDINWTWSQSKGSPWNEDKYGKRNGKGD